MRQARGQVLLVILAALVGVLIGAALVWGWMGRHSLPMDQADLVSCPTTAPPVSKEGQDAITAAVKRVGPAVVNITTRFAPNPDASPFGFSGPTGGEGSGIVIDRARGYVLTNAHVVKNATRVTVQLPSGRSYEAHVVGADPLSEVAVVRIPGGKELPVQATLGDSQAMPIGAWVIAIGNPYGFQNSVTVGVLSAKNRQVDGPSGVHLQDLMQTDASINPGNSGGALVDLSGNVIGIPTAMIPQAQGIGFAVPIDVAKQVAERLIHTGSMPWLGIQHRALEPREVQALRVPGGRGSLVVAVVPDSPARRAGFRPGDVIIRVGNREVKDTSDVGRAVRSHDAGTRLPITVWRDGREVRLDVTLGAAPQNLG